MGIGNIKTRTLGAIIAKAPPRAKIAPEAPMPVEREGARNIKSIFPTIPPRKYTKRNLPSPISLSKKLPKKYRLIMLQRICPKPPWTKRLVSIVQGWCRRSAGVKPRRKIASGLTRVIIKIKTFAVIKNQRAFKLTEL